jgi:hypothetical protein
VDSGAVCEGVLVSVEGTLAITQAVYSTVGTCPALAPRNPLVVSIDALGVVTAEPPVTIVEYQASGDWGAGTIAMTLTDDWAGVTPTVEYDVEVYPSSVFGIGLAFAGGDCQATVVLDATLCPPGVVACGVFADGWTVQCTDGVVYGDDLTRYAFCPSGSTVPSCEVGGEGARAWVATCGGACADTAVHVFETTEEYDAFDPQSLCAP